MLQIELAVALGYTPETFAQYADISIEAAEEVFQTKTNITPLVIQEEKFTEVTLSLGRLAWSALKQA